ncbi:MULTISPECIES: hypothetical protein [unclassified Pseudomonas]|uniref:hypothetical protein n=1 Tax=unclassified Pseudomonas TaxID=196821 RepID=UPI000A1EF678|nr:MULTISPECIES: hypothetical protein [unclassified Pseudomonas]
MDLKTLLVGVSAVTGIASAVLWVFSANARVPYKDRYNDDGSPIGTISDGKTDFILTAARQGRFNAWAAGAASVTAALQAIVILL